MEEHLDEGAAGWRSIWMEKHVNIEVFEWKIIWLKEHLDEKARRMKKHLDGDRSG